MKDQDGSSDQALLLAELKRVLKGRNIRYRDLAEQLKLSETTIKRNLAGRGLTLAALEAMCGVVGIRLIDLAEMAARRSNSKARALTAEQEQGLANNIFTAFIFLLLRYDWSPQDIQTEFRLGEPELVLHLRRLEKMRLLDLFPGNRVRLLTVRYPEWLFGGPLRRVIDATIRGHFEKMDFHDPKAVWELETVKLSVGSIAQLRTMITTLAHRMRELAAEDRALPLDQTEWYSMLCVARPIDPRVFWEEEGGAGAAKAHR
ncbi:helix-turn-helix transcriptional regulator [Sphingobium sp. EM0848]|uniref:helix-turn-helix domain-containing protein n=1 Tax=Sphingobium sp. EM0848 TaxID=2743473 RepID=UPI00159C0C3B|nr:helix-turn-helix transcriptional regulator [Sphingobium sp. EM0848]